jgi:hypothetical protein
MADDFECACGSTWRQNIVIRREGSFQSLPGLKIPEFLSGIRNPRHAHQMTLLANAVTSAGLKLCRIYDPTGSGIGKVLSRWTVAPFTGDALGWKYGRAIYIVST